MLHDDSTSKMAAYTSAADVEELTPVEEANQGHINDDFDDVFGSEPGSPIFPSDDHEDGDSLEENRRAGGNTEWSDIPRLKEKHETEGYRDGVTKGKAESVQKGFDEGYGLGATLGLKIGKILGLLEGIHTAVVAAAKDTTNEEHEEWGKEKGRLEKLVREAREELKTQSVFGRQWWGDDGIWAFEVPGEKEEGREVLFPDVAVAHPLVVKWQGVLDKEVERWGLDLGIMEHEDAEMDIGKSAKPEKERVTSTRPGAKKELEW